MILARQVLVRTPGLATTTLGAIAGAGVVGAFDDIIPGLGAKKEHRHRRRKMFTNTDIAQFAAAESIAGKAAARSLMMIRAAKA